MVLKGFPMYLHNLGIPSTSDVPARFLGIFLCVLSLAQQVCSNYSHVRIYASTENCLQDYSLSESCRKMTLKQGEERAKIWGKHDF